MNKKLLFLCTLAGTFAMAQNVGIGTTDPKSKLDVEGDMNIRKLGEDTGNSTYLAWNPETQNIAEGRPDKDIKLMKFYVKGPSATRGSGQKTEHDFAQYDTGIDASKYDLYVTNYVLNKWDDYGEHNWVTSTKGYYGYPKWQYSGSVNPTLNPDPIVKVEKVENKEGVNKGITTWHIIADIPGGNLSQAKGAGYEYGPVFWTFDALIMTKGISSSPEPITVNLGGNSGSLSKNPLASRKHSSADDLGADAIGDGKVGVGTDTPDATLQVEGKLRIANIDFPGANVTPIKIDDSSREIIAEKRTGGKPIKLVRYYVETLQSQRADEPDALNNTRDRLDILYTGIPVKKYNFIITNVAFLDKEGTPVPMEKEINKKQNPLLVVEAKKTPAANETGDIQWKINADFINSGPDKQYYAKQGRQGANPHRWEITALVIDKDYIEDITSKNTATYNNGKVNVIDGIHDDDSVVMTFGECKDYFMTDEYKDLKCPKAVQGLPKDN